MKKVLIIGNGSVGQALARSNWLSKHRQAAVSRTAAGPVGEFNITDAAQARDVLSKFADYDLVINTAAMTDVDGCERDAAAAQAANASGAKLVAGECARHRIPLIHLSTNYVFSGLADTDYAETDPAGPCSIYGITKLAGEIHALNEAPWCVVVRTSWIFGGRKRDFVNHFLEKLNAPGEVPVVGDQTACLTYAPDLAEALGTIAEEELWPAQKRGEPFRAVYHVTNAGALTRYDMLVEMKKILGKKSDIRKIPSGEFKGWAAVRPRFSALSNQSYRRRFGKSLRPWREALEEHLKACAS